MSEVGTLFFLETRRMVRTKIAWTALFVAFAAAVVVSQVVSDTGTAQFWGALILLKLSLLIVAIRLSKDVQSGFVRTVCTTPATKTSVGIARAFVAAALVSLHLSVYLGVIYALG